MSDIHRDDVLKKFTATQMLGVHSSRAIKRQRLDRYAKRTLRNVENLLKFQRTGMASRRENFVECISNMGAHAINVLSTAEVPVAPPPSSPSEIEDQQVLALCAPQDDTKINLDNIAGNVFFDLFRMTRETFSYVLDEISPFMMADDEEVEVKVAVALWILGGSEAVYPPLLKVPEEQRIQYLLEFCRQVTKSLMPKEISLHDRLDSSMWNFQCKFGLRNCAGALNFTHIPIYLGDMKDDACEYLNNAGFRSIIMQAVVSSDYKFCDLSIGYPGRTPVDHVLYNSAVWRKAESGVLFPAEGEPGPNQGPHPYLIAGTCYPLSERIVTPFQAPKFSDMEKRFNNSIYNALSVTQRAFKLLRSRFPFLLDFDKVTVEDTPAVVAACCVLHNICESRREITRKSWENITKTKQHLILAQGQPALVHELSPEAVEFRELVKNSMIHSYDRRF
ncbi:protein ALP1-like [Galendromus occidentalis]|uniref:Protein ALP1-like n=1 Tax=Galendromus occidentalis TaxID=34638 RepID=A0AAJ6QSE1_9ACAR|nr:protein ALP1-like [Galendromus occidentalis]